MLPSPKQTISEIEGIWNDNMFENNSTKNEIDLKPKFNSCRDEQANKPQTQRHILWNINSRKDLHCFNEDF